MGNGTATGSATTKVTAETGAIRDRETYPGTGIGIRGTGVKIAHGHLPLAQVETATGRPRGPAHEMMV